MGPIMVCIKVTVTKHVKIIKEDVVTWVDLRKEFPLFHVHGVMGPYFKN